MANHIAVRLPPLDELARLWPELEPMLKRATDRVLGYEPIDILALAFAQRMAIWVIEDDGAPIACAVTEVKQFPRCRVLEVPFIAGRGLRRWHEKLLEALDDHAQRCGCQSLMGFDRKGWSHFGFRVAGAVMVRELS